MPRKKANTERVTTFFPEKQYTQIQKKAEEKGLPVSTYVRMVVMEQLPKENETA